MSREKIAVVMAKYLPEGTVDICTKWIVEKNIHLKLTRGRASKFGDYRPLEKGKGHRITVNHDLNKYAFLITFTHEVAHLNAFIKYARRHEPHGKEWKNEFSQLLKEFVQTKVFPADIENAMMKYLKNPAASSCSDVDLFRVLKKYDDRPEEVFHLEDLQPSAQFSLFQSRSGLVFSKGHLIRKRFHCVEIHSKKAYLVSPLAEVIKFVQS